MTSTSTTSTSTSTVRRPGPIHWLWYAMGGALPPRYRDWVLHDVTTSTWPMRQMIRSLVQMLPVGLLLVLLVPGALWVRLVAVLGGAIVGMIYAASYVYETTEHRALKAGFARGQAQAVRDQANAGEREAAALRYAQRYREEPAIPRSSE